VIILPSEHRTEEETGTTIPLSSPPDPGTKAKMVRFLRKSHYKFPVQLQLLAVKDRVMRIILQPMLDMKNLISKGRDEIRDMAPRPIKGLHSILNCFKLLSNLKHGRTWDPLIPTSFHSFQEKRVINKVVKKPEWATLVLRITK